MPISFQADAASKQAYLKQCQFEQNLGGGVSVIASSSFTATMAIDNCGFTNNGGTALSASGTGALIRVSDCTINSNTTGISANNGGQILSRRNNTLEDNPTGNTFPGTYRPK